MSFKALIVNSETPFSLRDSNVTDVKCPPDDVQSFVFGSSTFVSVSCTLSFSSSMISVFSIDSSASLVFGFFFLIAAGSLSVSSFRFFFLSLFSRTKSSGVCRKKQKNKQLVSRFHCTFLQIYNLICFSI